MTPTILITSGTPFGTWHSLADRLLQGAPLNFRLTAFSAWHAAWVGDDVNAPVLPGRAQADALDTAVPGAAMSWGGLDARACWTAEWLAGHWPQARFLLFIDRPALMLAASACQTSAGAAETLLHTWAQGAASLLRLAQRSPARCLLVDADEARRDPGAVIRIASKRFGIEFGEPGTADGTASSDVLSRAMADAVVAAERRLSGLSAELVASCTLLEPDGAWVPSALDPIAGWPRLRELMALERVPPPPHAPPSRDAEVDLLTVQLQMLREELDSSLSARQRIDTELISERGLLDQVGRQAADERVRLEQERDEHAQRLVHNALRLAASEAECNRLRREADAVLRRGEAARMETDLLNMRLRQLQEEVERLCTAAAAQSAPARKTTSRHMTPSGQVELLAVRDETPHRELTLLMRRVELDGRLFERIQVRLVEHHDRPGLVLLASSTNEQVLRNWTESGREGECSFVLFVPSDADSIGRLNALGSSDWRLVNALAGHIEQQLGSNLAPGTTARWRTVAARLTQELADLPPQLRVDNTQLVVGAEADVLDITLHRVTFDRRELKRMRLRGRGQLELVGAAPSDAVLPLYGWPVDAGGLPAERLGVGIGGDVQGWQVFQRLPSPDREFLSALVAALPALVEQAGSRVAAPEAAVVALRQSAVAWLAQARRTARGPALRRAARVLLGKSVVCL